MINKIKIISLIVILVTVVLVGYFYDFNVREIFLNLKMGASSHPIVTSLMFILLYTFFKFSFVPMASASVLAGYLFGFVWGVALAIISILFSSWLMFYLSRSLGRQAISGYMSNRFDFVEKYNKKIEEHGIKTVLFFRIVPILPLAVVNMGFGLSRVALKDFLIATVVGTLPGVIFLVGAGKYITNWQSPIFWLFSGLYIVMIGTAYFLSKKYKNKL